MKCEKCGKEANRLRYDKENKIFVCSGCVSTRVMCSPAFLHTSAGNKWAPKLTLAKQDVFKRSTILPSGEVIDRATGREAAY